MKKLLPVLALALIATPAAAKKLPKALAKKAEDAKNPIVRVETSEGVFHLELFPKEAPKTVANFLGLATGKKAWVDPKTGKKVKRPFYDGLTFHRIVDGFMIQGGDPKGDGTGRPGYTFADEINADALGLDKAPLLQRDGRPDPRSGIQTEDQFYEQAVNPLLKKMGIDGLGEARLREAEIDKRIRALTLKQFLENLGYVFETGHPSRPPTRGVLAMANSGPATNGSQFFVTLVDTPWLTGRHTVFGRVLDGMEVVEKIGKVAVDAKGRPDKPVVIKRVRRLR